MNSPENNVRHNNVPGSCTKVPQDFPHELLQPAAPITYSNDAKINSKCA